MTKERFWEIIAASRLGFDAADIDASMNRQMASLHALLSALSVEEIQAFDALFGERMKEAYAKPTLIVDMEPKDDSLWAIAYALGGGCSDDGFWDFRSWLISMGREVYEAALTDPKTLFEVVRAAELDEEVFFEEFGYVASRVWREKTGTED